ncbi:DNA cytosine methyltransferase [Mycoplasmopsis agassizii]|uniref:DNA (cytosine-5-)-methyltransferase n=1 Tax=Mycoplasmopsis agassizii TaxID=33922 RepID=A0ABX4H5E1_9BACT|nr:DNA cytosine methyltransferase [Mycoplasmopsis agassizii]PAF55085.1 DNA cytosine methyltransferase [Mycoplasmopsis agassizii]SMC19152.1 DNA (cytosine-5)-methyltransferase 1 [Mycoplasmopsis agassizii]
MSDYKIIDLFSGAGGFSLGFENAGFESILAIDKWNDAIETYNFNRNKKVGTTRDIFDFTNEEIFNLNSKGEVVGIIGGPPCQGFSMVGTRDEKDERNTLYLQFVRFVEIIKPKFFILENVKGLLTMSKGFFKKDIVERFSKLGYNVNYKILKASNYGVPQSRDRVFFIGLLSASFADKFFDFDKIIKMKEVSTKDALSDLPDLDNNEDHTTYARKPENQFQKEMRKNSKKIFNNVVTNHTKQTIDIIKQVPDGGNIMCLDPKYYSVRNYKSAFKRMNSSLPSSTIDCGHRNYFHYSQNRVPTARESARLQSFPDRYIFTGNKSSQYTQVGNAVPPRLAQGIAKAMISIVSGENNESI